MIFYELLPIEKGERINSDKYCQQLDNLKTASPVLANIYEMANQKGVFLSR